MDSFELLTSEKMKLLGRTENEIIKDKNGENVLHLEITEVALIQCNIVNNLVLFGNTKVDEIIVPLKYLSNFQRTREIPLIVKLF